MNDGNEDNLNWFELYDDLDKEFTI